MRAVALLPPAPRRAAPSIAPAAGRFHGIVDQSPRGVTQRRLAAFIQGSPRIAAQTRRQAALLGAVAQCAQGNTAARLPHLADDSGLEKDESLQMKSEALSAVQRSTHPLQFSGKEDAMNLDEKKEKPEKAKKRPPSPPPMLSATSNSAAMPAKRTKRTHKKTSGNQSGGGATAIIGSSQTNAPPFPSTTLSQAALQQFVTAMVATHPNVLAGLFDPPLVATTLHQTARPHPPHNTALSRARSDRRNPNDNKDTGSTSSQLAHNRNATTHAHLYASAQPAFMLQPSPDINSLLMFGQQSGGNFPGPSSASANPLASHSAATVGSTSDNSGHSSDSKTNPLKKKARRTGPTKAELDDAAAFRARRAAAKAEDRSPAAPIFAALVKLAENAGFNSVAAATSSTSSSTTSASNENKEAAKPTTAASSSSSPHPAGQTIQNIRALDLYDRGTEPNGDLRASVDGAPFATVYAGGTGNFGSELVLALAEPENTRWFRVTGGTEEERGVFVVVSGELEFTAQFVNYNPRKIDYDGVQIADIQRALAWRLHKLQQEANPRSGLGRAVDDEKAGSRENARQQAAYRDRKWAFAEGGVDAARDPHFQATKSDDTMEATITHYKHWPKRDRGSGQADAMGGQNAKNHYVDWRVAQSEPDAIKPKVATDIFPEMQGRFEWLHLIGSSLGGPTIPGNLVAGTYDANTKMIPLEHRVAIYSLKEHEKKALAPSQQTPMVIKATAKLGQPVEKGGHKFQVATSIDLQVTHGGKPMISRHYDTTEKQALTKTAYRREQKRVKKAIWRAKKRRQPNVPSVTTVADAATNDHIVDSGLDSGSDSGSGSDSDIDDEKKTNSFRK